MEADVAKKRAKAKVSRAANRAAARQSERRLRKLAARVENPDQARLLSVLSRAGLDEASIDQPFEQDAAARTAKAQLEQEQALAGLADRLAEGIADRLLLTPARATAGKPSDRVTTSAGWAGDGAHFPEAERPGPVRETIASGPSVERTKTGGALRVAPMPAMKVALNSLSSELDELEATIARFGDALEPVLLDGPDGPSNPDTGLGRPMAGSSMLVRALEGQTGRVSRATAALSVMLSKVEV